MWPFTKKFGPIKSIPDGHWAVAVDERNGVIVRMNSWAKKVRGHPDYAHMIRILTHFPPDIPYDRINDEDGPFAAMEQRLFAALHNNAESIVVVVRTMPDGREFVCHSRDAAAAVKRLNFVFADFKKLKPSQTTEHDPGWAYASRVCGWSK